MASAGHTRQLRPEESLGAQARSSAVGFGIGRGRKCGKLFSCPTGSEESSSRCVAPQLLGTEPRGPVPNKRPVNALLWPPSWEHPALLSSSESERCFQRGAGF